MSQQPNPTGPKRSYLENLLFGQLEKYRKQLTDSKAEVSRLQAALVSRLRKYDELLDTCNELTVALRECVEAVESSLPEDEESDSVPTMKLSEVWARRERARAVLAKWFGENQQ